MQSAIDRALGALSERVGDIDDYVAEKLGYTRDELLGTETTPGYFSAEQVDALAMAIANVEQGAGFVVGDQTGVGKGRFVAGMLRYAKRRGLTPIFVTKQPGLFADMVRRSSRHWRRCAGAIGSPHQPLARKIRGAPLQRGR